jgi:hypothetical protein
LTRILLEFGVSRVDAFQYVQVPPNNAHSPGLLLPAAMSGSSYASPTGDLKAAWKFIDGQCEQGAKRKQAVQGIKDLVADLFPKAVKASGSKEKKAKTDKSEPVITTATWHAKVECEWLESVAAFAPPTARVWANKAQGLFKVSVAKKVRHFSWTSRGGPSAAKCSLKFLWEGFVSAYGGEIPAHLDFSDVVF